MSCSILIYGETVCCDLCCYAIADLENCIELYCIQVSYNEMLLLEMTCYVIWYVALFFSSLSSAFNAVIQISNPWIIGM